MSVLASRIDQNGVFVAQRRRFRVIVFLSIAFGFLKLRDKEAQRRRWKQIGGSANQKRSYQDKYIGQSNQSHPRRKDKVSFSSNQIRLAGRQGERIVIQTSCCISTNKNPSAHPLDNLRDEDVVLEIVRRMLRRNLIGQDKDVVLEIVRRMLRRLLIGRDKATCPYDDASDLSSFQTDLIGQEGNLVFSSWTRLIGMSDGLVLLRMLLIG